MPSYHSTGSLHSCNLIRRRRDKPWQVALAANLSADPSQASIGLEKHLVLARKWRPEHFSELAGQEHVTRTLIQALKSGRIAHAFLFTGIRGVGKTTAARILARCLNCERGPTPEPCGECAACVEIRAGRALDVVETPIPLGRQLLN